MKIDILKNEAKRLGLRVTKKVKGKRVPLSEKELKVRIERRRQPALEIQVRNSKKLIRTCKSLLKTMEPSVPKAPRVSVKKVESSVARAPPIPPAPPVPLRPVKRDPRANLMTALKANLERRGIRQKLNQTS
jgi:hypothetical protein